MECNKEEAIRAKEIAEKKMQSKDFVGARKIALKAQQLYPGLESISQMLTVCDVHCCADNKLYGSEMNWYGILQIEQTADEASIKKQFRRLALLLHPDKNKFAGAEAAFKLIGEAQRILSDQQKRALFDMKYKHTLRNSTPTQPSQQVNRTSYVRKQPGVQNSAVNIGLNLHQQQQKQTRPGLNPHQQQQKQTQPGLNPYQQQQKQAQPGLNPYQQQQQQAQPGLNPYQQQQKQAQPGFTNGQQTFWTLCPYCGIRYQYYRNILNRNVLCPRCTQPFFAYELNAQGVYMGAKFSRPDDNDFSSPSKRSRGNGSFSAVEPSSKGEIPKTDKSSGFASAYEKAMKKESPLGESLPNGNYKNERCKENGKVAGVVDGDEERDKVEFFECPDPDFSNFDKDRKEECFAVEQIWAIYDTVDGMPRFYARIRKVFSPGFKLRITWLEADPDDHDEINWTKEDLPVACGKFKHGLTEDTEDLPMFSHLTCWKKGIGRASYKIYPMKGETWALFKNWDIKWNSDPDNHRKYEFEFVEVLSEFAENGICVTYLHKVKGFVSLFSQITKKGKDSFQIPPNELFRFSHRVPSFRMTGREREDVPEGSFELDPAALPTNLKEFAQFEDVKIDKIDVKNKGSCSNSPTENVIPMAGSGRPNMQTNSMDLDEKNDAERGKEDISSDSVAKDPSSSSVLSQEPDKMSETELFDFEAQRSYEKFQRGQIWAMYSDVDGMPKYYAQIRSITSPPDFKLYISWLEACSPPKDRIQWLDKNMPVGCGSFKLANSNDNFDACSFSHQLKAKHTGKNRYGINPSKGEVWALYKNWNAKWTCSDLPNCKYDIVEVVEDNSSGMKVQVLVRLDGYKSVFKAKKEGRSAVTMEIPRMELVRFSHQIPAFCLTDERDGSLRGCWVLDPSSLPPP